MSRLKFALAQMSPRLGDFAGNVGQILAFYERACREQVRFVLTPELSLCGYPPLDLVQTPEWRSRCDAALRRCLEATRGQPTALIVGHVYAGSGPRGLHNGLSVLQDGQVVFTQAKSLLPTYDVFDEARTFDPAPEVKLWDCDGTSVALAICEDLWGETAQEFGKHYYTQKDVLPTHLYQRLGAKLILGASASPWEWGKGQRRLEVHAQIAKKLSVPLVYCNAVAASDELLFDGQSFVLNAQGKLAALLPAYQTAFLQVALDVALEVSAEPLAVEQDWVRARQGLVYGIREYFSRSGFKRALVGLSGGIDSALVACLAVEALGAENVRGVAMPGPYSSGHSLTDAETLAKNLGIAFEVKPIKFLYQAAMREWGDGRGGLSSIAQENLQSRLRGMLLMTLSNHDGSLVLTTGNKSEIATGYCTLYGDMAGAIAPIGDLLKTEVYTLSQRFFADRIPSSTLTKAPSAELRANQTDQDTLPPYEELDAFIRQWWVEGLALDEVRKSPALGKNAAAWVDRIARLMHTQEYKRSQGAPILRLSAKAFGIGRRVPVAKIWAL